MYRDYKIVDEIPNSLLESRLASRLPYLVNPLTSLLHYAADMNPKIVVAIEELSEAEAKYAALPICPSWGKPGCLEGVELYVTIIPRLTRRLAGLRAGERRRILRDLERTRTIIQVELARRRMLGIYVEDELM